MSILLANTKTGQFANLSSDNTECNVYLAYSILSVSEESTTNITASVLSK